MASPSEGPLERLIREIHRRSLWQVLGIYVVASWIVLQVIDTLEGMVTLPEWFAGLVIGFLVLGLPVVLATAFVQQGGPGRDAGDVEVAGPDASPIGASGLFTWRKTFGGASQRLEVSYVPSLRPPPRRPPLPGVTRRGGDYVVRDEPSV